MKISGDKIAEFRQLHRRRTHYPTGSHHNPVNLSYLNSPMSIQIFRIFLRICHLLQNSPI